MKKLVVFTAVALFGTMAVPARAFTHPCIPASLSDLAYIKANLNREPWKSSYAVLANASTSQLSWHQEGPYTNVSRTPDVNLQYWKDDMSAVYNLAQMWYFTGNTAYAQKAHDILLSWATTQTSFSGQEMDLSLGDYAVCYVGGADILRATWPGWTDADTTTVKNYFENVTWPATLAGFNTTGPANKGMLYLEAGIAVAAFCDDVDKFNHCIDVYRTSPASGLLNTLPTGEMGETGRDEGHADGTLAGMAVISEIAWKQGIDLYSEQDNRLLACGEYYARNSLVFDSPFVPFGTIDYTYYANAAYYNTADRSTFAIIQNAYKTRKGLPTPWIDLKLPQQPAGGDLMFAKDADFSTATPMAPVVRPDVSLASSGLTLTTLGSQTAGRNVSYSNGVWTIAGLGNGIWTGTGGADDCQFAYQAMTGDCAMVGKVTSCTFSGSQNGKVGFMIRDSLSATISQRAWVSITPTTSGTPLVECREDGWTEIWGGSNRQSRSQSLPPGLPYWIKIERRGGMINTYTSQDGTSWAAELSAYYANLPSTIYIGMFISSGNTTANTATLANVAFTGGSGGLITAPAAPATVLASGSSAAITVRWLPSFGATSYNVLRSTTSGGGYARIASGLSTATTSYVDTTVAPGTTYYYVVQAANSVGTSGNSPEFYGSLLPAPMVNIAFGGTTTASVNAGPQVGGSDTAFDSDPGSKWYCWSSPTGWIQYDFGANNAQVIKRYTINSADVPSRDPVAWSLLGSQDGSTWTTLDTQSGQSFAFPMAQNTYNIGNTTAYRYYQLNITANNGASGVALSELGLWSDTGRTMPDGTYYLLNRYGNKPMAALNGGTANSTQLVQWTYSGGSEQKWTLAYQGNGQYKITGLASGRVVNVSGNSGANGANLILWDWNGANNELWSITPTGDSYFKVTALNSGKVADVAGPSTADGAVVHQWSAVGVTNQKWTFTIMP
jgi:hypothetical protein